MNIQKKTITTKTIWDKEKKEDHFKQLYIFIAISYNYKKVVPYTSSNSNGKISSKVYIEQVLPTLKEDLQRLDLTLY